MVVRPFANLFYYMENCGILNPLNDIHCLRCISFIVHVLTDLYTSSECSITTILSVQSPHQLFSVGALRFANQTGGRSVILGEVPDSFGVDEEAPWPEMEAEGENIVNVSSPRNPLQPEHQDRNH